MSKETPQDNWDVPDDPVAIQSPVGHPRRYEGYWGKTRRALDEIFYPTAFREAPPVVVKKGRSSLGPMYDRVKSTLPTKKTPEEGRIAMESSKGDLMHETVIFVDAFDQLVNVFFDMPPEEHREALETLRVQLSPLQKIMQEVSGLLSVIINQYAQKETFPDCIVTMKVIQAEAEGERQQIQDCLICIEETLGQLKDVPLKNAPHYLSEGDRAVANLMSLTEGLCDSMNNFFVFIDNLHKSS